MQIASGRGAAVLLVSNMKGGLGMGGGGGPVPALGQVWYCVLYCTVL